MSSPLPFRFTERAEHIRELARQLLDTHGLTDWEFGFNTNLRRAGVCFYPQQGEPGRIELSLHFAEHNQEEVRDTILHEIAHALVGPGHGHDAVWRAKCLAIGAKPEACCGDGIAMPKGRWRANCPGCDAEFDRHRRPETSGGWFCRACGPKAGALRWRDATQDDD
jgi:predicted SprT family Zn-dependent metalloprotease